MFFIQLEIEEQSQSLAKLGPINHCMVVVRSRNGKRTLESSQTFLISKKPSEITRNQILNILQILSSKSSSRMNFTLPMARKIMCLLSWSAKASVSATCQYASQSKQKSSMIAWSIHVKKNFFCESSIELYYYKQRNWLQLATLGYEME